MNRIYKVSLRVVKMNYDCVKWDFPLNPPLPSVSTIFTRALLRVRNWPVVKNICLRVTFKNESARYSIIERNENGTCIKQFIGGICAYDELRTYTVWCNLIPDKLVDILVYLILPTLTRVIIFQRVRVEIRSDKGKTRPRFLVENSTFYNQIKIYNHGNIDFKRGVYY